MSKWEKVTDDEGREYYYNPTTEETSWTNPEEEGEKGEWQVYFTEDGKEYYYNAASGETTWERPLEMDERATAAIVDEEDPEGLTSGEAKKDDVDIGLEAKPLASNELINPPQFGSFNEAEKAFTQLLKDNDVDSTWSFQLVMARFIKNPTYWAIPDSLHRKKLYDSYLETKFKEQIANKTETVKTFEKSFTEVLKEYHSQGKLDYDTRWISVRKKLIQDEHPIFKHSLLSDDEIAKRYYAYTAGLRKEHNDDLKTKKEEALRELEIYLTQTNKSSISEKLDWEKLYDQLQSDSRFKANVHFTVLERHEVLTLYQNKIYPQIIEGLKEELSRIEKANYRNDRIARDNYKKLLRSLEIDADTLFKDIFPLIENEDAFIEIVGRNGSTPLELFFDIVDEKRQSIKLKRDMIENILLDLKNKDPSAYDRNRILESKESFIECLRQLRDDRLNDFGINTANVDDTNIEVTKIYNNMRRDHEFDMRRKHQEYIKERTRLVNLSADWLLENYTTLERLKFAQSDSDTDPAKVNIITNGDTSSFTVPERESLTEIFVSIPHFKKIETLLSSSTPDIIQDPNSEIPMVADDILKAFVKSYDITLRRRAEKKRSWEDDSNSKNSKKTKHDAGNGEGSTSPKANPIVLNY